jgi:2-oxoisovalerate dehydrogenase E1 component
MSRTQGPSRIMSSTDRATHTETGHWPELLGPLALALGDGRFPAPLSPHQLKDTALIVELFESQLQSRLMDLESRKRAARRETFYSIASAGHEGNAAIARAARVTDPAFLHYRSGAFLIERARQKPGETPLFDMALSFVASAHDPISGGRHKVIGSRSLNIPPQTSTIASHLPKAVGSAFAITLGRQLRLEGQAPDDAIVLCSFGDASANHSTARGAFNAAGWAAHQGTAMPVLFVCEDNGIGISVASPDGWTAASLSCLPHIRYFHGSGLDLADAMNVAQQSVEFVRRTRKPALLHLKTVRLYGHAGSDVETAYRSREVILREAADDPLLHSARRVLETGLVSSEQMSRWVSEQVARVARLFDLATLQPRLTTAEAIMEPIARPLAHPERPVASMVQGNGEPVLMSRAIAETLAALMSEDPRIVVFGEDVARKGGVYGATKHLMTRHGRARVFDTLLDEQGILGTAIGLAQQGFLPIPEIQFLAYVHNAIDQLRGEAATLRFFSNSAFDNPMVIRIAGLGYQKGFGGHFHNDNGLAAFRDIPGLVVLCPSSPGEASASLREAVRLAREERRVVIHLEPIALYNTKDLHTDGDNAFLEPVSSTPMECGSVGQWRDGKDIALVTYGNGSYMCRRVAERLKSFHGIDAAILDLRAVMPLPYAALAQALGSVATILIVDEARRSGSPSEALMTWFAESGERRPFARVTSEDSFIPLGPAANSVLLSEETIEATVLSLVGNNRNIAS